MKNRHGIQITSSRLGKLEKELIKYILDLPKGSVGLDLGGGDGYITMILALLQKKIFLYDLDISLKLKLFKRLFNLKRLNLKKQDLKIKDNYKSFPKKIDFVYAARFLHYLEFNEAENLLKKLSNILKTEGKIFFTLSGLNSDLGNNYPSKNKNIKKRYGLLSEENQGRFQIKEKITLYTLEEVKKLFETHFVLEEIWESDFKNIFIIAKKK